MFLFTPHSFVYTIYFYFPRFSIIERMRVTFDCGVGFIGSIEQICRMFAIYYNAYGLCVFEIENKQKNSYYLQEWIFCVFYSSFLCFDHFSEFFTSIKCVRTDRLRCCSFRKISQLSSARINAFSHD